MESQFEKYKIPPEIIMQIGKYLSKADTLSFSLSCKKFYEIMCDESEQRVLIRLCNRDIHEADIESIMNTTRRIRDTRIVLYDQEGIEIIKKVVEKIGTDINEFRIDLIGDSGEEDDIDQTHAVPYNNAEELLSFVPNVKSLCFVIIEGTTEESRNEGESKQDWQFKQLKSLVLSVIEDGFDYGRFLKKIADDVLKEAEVDLSVTAAVEFFKKQKNIKILRIWLIGPLTEMPENLLGDIKLNHLTWNVRVDDENQSTKFAKIFAQQTQLTKLSHMDPIHDEALRILTSSIKTIESFEVCVDKLSPDAFRTISKWIHLKELKLNSSSENDPKFIKAFIRMNNSRISNLTLDIYGVPNIPKLMSQTAKSAPNLKALKITGGANIESNIDELLNVLSNLRALESLECRLGKRIREQFPINDELLVKKDNLKRLIVPCLNIPMNLLKKMVTAYPNLEEISVPIEEGGCMIRHLMLMLRGWKKLTHLLIYSGVYVSQCCCSVDDLDFIVEHGKNLKFIGIPFSHVITEQQIRAKVGDRFDYIQVFENSNRVKMATNKKSLEFEL